MGIVNENKTVFLFFLGKMLCMRCAIGYGIEKQVIWFLLDRILVWFYFLWNMEALFALSLLLV